MKEIETQLAEKKQEVLNDIDDLKHKINRSISLPENLKNYLLTKDIGGIIDTMSNERSLSLLVKISKKDQKPLDVYPLFKNESNDVDFDNHHEQLIVILPSNTRSICIA